MKRRINIIFATLVAVSLILTAFSAIASAADINISVNGDVPQIIAQLYGYIKGPLQVGMNYFIAFMQYLAGYIAQF